MSLITMFISLTNEGWSEIVYIINSAFNPIIVNGFFISFLFIASFFVINLILAVLSMYFVKQAEENEKSLLQDKLAKTQ